MTDQAPALKSSGILKKGEPKKGNGPGRDLAGTFRFEGKGNDYQKRHIEEAFKRHYPDPTKIRAWLVYPQASSNFDAWMELWGSGNWLKVRCNQEQIVRWYDGACYQEGPKPCKFAHREDNRNGE